jgi:CheY-like chemotaxis protein
MRWTKKPVLKRREQILVVEDDVDSCELIGEVLHEAGYSVDLAHDGFQALEAAARRKPDVMLSDLQMPGIDGLELTKRMHAADPDLPVVIATGVENTKDVITAAEGYGVATCLKKPMRVDELLWAIDSALALSRQRGRRPGPPMVVPTASNAAPTRVAPSARLARR